jgi:hypothetical protein
VINRIALRKAGRKGKEINERVEKAMRCEAISMREEQKDSPSREKEICSPAVEKQERKEKGGRRELDS